MDHIKKGRGFVYTIRYYLSWCVMNGKEVLTEEIKVELLKILENIAKDNDIIIVDYSFKANNCTLILDCKPQHYIPNMIKAFKGVSARMLVKAFPDLKNTIGSNHIWNSSYFIATTSELPEYYIWTKIEEYRLNEMKYK